MKKVFFVGANKLLIPFLNASATKYKTLLCNGMTYPVLHRDIIFLQCDLIDGGLSRLFNFFNIQISSPFLYKGLKGNLEKHAPDAIVHFDIIRLAVVQVVRYVRRHPECRLYLYCETKKWPRNPVSKIVLWLLVFYVRRNHKYITKIIVYTQQGLAWFTKQFPEIEVVLCPVSIDETMFFPTPAKTYLPDATLRIIINARFVPFKRHDDLFQALVSLQKKGLHFSCTCIGTGGHTRSVLEQNVASMGLSSRVQFLDAVSAEEVREIYWNHDVLVLPSEHEPIGWVVPEAMACGLATITSDTVGANVYVQEGITGYIHTTGDPRDIANFLEKLYEVSVLERLSLHAQQHITSQYTTQLCNDRFLEIIK